MATPAAVSPTALIIDRPLSTSIVNDVKSSIAVYSNCVYVGQCLVELPLN